ncbi:MAG: GxxExxY protein [Puniceicoccaceae bacterium]
MREDLLLKDECYRIQGAVFEVYRELGCGFSEGIYQESLEIEFSLQGIPFVSQSELKVAYKGRQLRQTFRPDFICYDSVVVELKALRVTAPDHESQVLSYLKATGFRLGLLVNFGGHPKATIKRLVL